MILISYPKSWYMNSDAPYHICFDVIYFSYLEKIKNEVSTCIDKNIGIMTKESIFLC